MLLFLSSETSRLIIFLMILSTLSLSMHLHQRRLQQSQNTIPNRFSTFLYFLNSTIDFDSNRPTAFIPDNFQERTHFCRENALAFYESCFQLSIKILEPEKNRAFVKSFWAVCSKLSLTKFNRCLTAGNWWREPLCLTWQFLMFSSFHINSLLVFINDGSQGAKTFSKLFGMSMRLTV